MTFRAKLEPWFKFVQDFNQSLAHLGSSPIDGAAIDLKDAGFAAWQVTESQVGSIIGILQDLEANYFNRVVRIFGTAVAVVLSTTGGVFSSLLIMSLELVVGFICHSVGERWFHWKSEELCNILKAPL